MIPSCTEDSLRIWDPAEDAGFIVEELGCSPLLATLLWMRGVRTPEDLPLVPSLMTPDLAESMDMVQLGPDAASAAKLWSEVGPGDRVVVYGDYDVDGISATAIMLELALLKGAHAKYYIPHRFNQGYGFHPSIAEAIAKRGCDLLIVVDCGSQDARSVEIAKSHGIPVIILDHHLVEGTPAECAALVNPQVGGNDSARKLCAAGVVWSWAWKNGLAPEDWLMQRLQLAALATVADCVPLSSPVNRAIVREGISVLRRSPRVGLASLVRNLGVDLSSIDAECLAMRVIPCLNAAGRLDLADTAMKIIFPGVDLDEQVTNLISLNNKRRDLSVRIISDVSSKSDEYKHVLFGEEWPVGVLSSVASRICGDRGIPIALAAPAQSLVRGTIRMPAGGDAVAVLKELSSDLNTWGGHRLAAGFSVHRDNWRLVRKKMESALSRAPISEEKLDVFRWSPRDLDMREWIEIERLGPFGVDNPHPLLYCGHKGPIEYQPLGKKGSHYRIIEDSIPLLAFNADGLLDREPVGWVYKPRVDAWRFTMSLQFTINRVVLR